MVNNAMFPSMQLASMSPDASSRAVLPGDILRAVTCTCVVYPSQALFGLKPPQKTIVSVAWCDGIVISRWMMVHDGAPMHAGVVQCWWSILVVCAWCMLAQSS